MKLSEQVRAGDYPVWADRIAELEAENQRLKKRLTQNPRDARCQLYKLVQKYNHEAESCNSLCDRLKDENQRLRDAIEECVKQMDYAESFICTKVKMHQDGQYCFDLAMRKAKQALEKET